MITIKVTITSNGPNPKYSLFSSCSVNGMDFVDVENLKGEARTKVENAPTRSPP
jgi:hypothetical protein